MGQLTEPPTPDSHRDWLDIDELGTLERLHWTEGGNSTMYRCFYQGQEYVYKAYRERFLTEANPSALGRLIAWRESLSEDDRRYLDLVAAWPRHRVGKAGSLRGVLVPFARQEFFIDTGAGSPLPHTMIRLIRYQADRVIRPGAPLAVKKRALGCAIEVVLWFHAQSKQIRVNDVHVQNILCTQDGRAVYFVDCDAMLGGWGAVARPAAPEHIRRLVPQASAPTQMTDMVRMAWAVLCILLNDIGLLRVNPALLDKMLPRQTTEFLIRATRARREDTVPVREWRKLAQHWVNDERVSGRAAIPSPPVLIGTPVTNPQHPQQLGPTRPATSTWRRRYPYEWVPDEFRRSGPFRRVSFAPPTRASSRPKPRAPVRPSLLLVSGIAVAVLSVLVVLVLLTTMPGSLR